MGSVKLIPLQILQYLIIVQLQVAVNVQPQLNYSSTSIELECNKCHFNIQAQT